jgi:hypothetical protein
LTNNINKGTLLFALHAQVILTLCQERKMYLDPFSGRKRRLFIEGGLYVKRKNVYFSASNWRNKRFCWTCFFQPTVQLGAVSEPKQTGTLQIVDTAGQATLSSGKDGNAKIIHNLMAGNTYFIQASFYRLSFIRKFFNNH